MAFAGNALAQVDPDPDGIGMYFDMGGTQYCADGVGGGQVLLYLVITRASQASGVSGWEAHVDYTVPDGCFEQGWTLLGDGPLNVSAAPDFIVGLATPFPGADAIAIAEYGVLVFCADCIEFVVRAADNPSLPGVPLYAAGDDPGLFIPLQNSAGEGGATGQINCGCSTVPNEDATWGSLKTLYR
jgi:hypothetical protein